MRHVCSEATDSVKYLQQTRTAPPLSLLRPRLVSDFLSAVLTQHSQTHNISSAHVRGARMRSTGAPKGGRRCGPGRGIFFEKRASSRQSQKQVRPSVRPHPNVNVTAFLCSFGRPALARFCLRRIQRPIAGHMFCHTRSVSVPKTEPHKI